MKQQKIPKAQKYLAEYLNLYNRDTMSIFYTHFKTKSMRSLYLLHVAIDRESLYAIYP